MRISDWSSDVCSSDLLAFGDGRCFILRIPGKGTEAYIDRVVELHNARVAAEAGVSAEVIYGDADSGLMLTRCIDGIVTMSPEKFRERAGAPARAAEALKDRKSTRLNSSH